MSRLARTRLLSALLLGLVSVVVPGRPARAAAPVDLFISDVSDSPDPVFAGSTVSYTVQVGNRGPGTATSTLLTAPLPAGASFQGSNDDRCSATSTLITCDLGTLGAPGMASPVIIQVRPTEAGTLSLTFTVSSAEPDANPSDNSRTATTTVTTPTEADVALRLSAQYNPIYAGTQFLICSTRARPPPPAPPLGCGCRPVFRSSPAPPVYRTGPTRSASSVRWSFRRPPGSPRRSP